MSIRTIFFDFGGCIDSPGIHTRTLFLREFVAHKVLTVDDRDAFQEAYTKADQELMMSGAARLLGLRDFNRLQARLITRFLGWAEAVEISVAADAITEAQAYWINRSYSVLQELSRGYALGVISNFTGNLEVILREFELRNFFSHVTESFYVGTSKPDERIFLEALGKQSGEAESCLFVGDNPANDIAPAKRLGMKTALIHSPGEKRECGADYYLTDLAEFASLIRS